MNRVFPAVMVVMFVAVVASVWAAEPPAAPPPAGDQPAAEAAPAPPPPAPPPPAAPAPIDWNRLRNMTPAERQQFIQNLPPDQRVRVQQTLRNMQNRNTRDDFVTRYLRDNEEFIKLQDEHQQKLQDITQQLRDLSAAAKAKLNDPNVTAEARDQVVGETKGKVRGLLTPLLEEQIKYQKAVNELVTKCKDEILDKATEAVFAGQDPMTATGGGRGGNQPGVQPGNQPRNQPGNQPGIQPGNQPGNQPAPKARGPRGGRGGAGGGAAPPATKQ